ncbi:hypothetical protein [Chroococcidiopsis sp. CCNUC1]|nr:hypothetical protein [Chroococcidiopsis sp. CCNUC1]URD53495.1 hypothetical protein M5J74_29435 [Chroococcidiopsis sp. CCNUC1]
MALLRRSPLTNQTLLEIRGWWHMASIEEYLRALLTGTQANRAQRTR